jgi:hypothetical protein
MEINQIIAEIDTAHSAANLAQKNKDIGTYIGCFSNDLKYKQLNGKIIDKKQLLQDVQSYFDRVRSHISTYDRVSSSVGSDLFIEKIVQKAIVTISVFIFFSKTWTVEREGIYEWKKEDGHWKISTVEVTSEKII